MEDWEGINRRRFPRANFPCLVVLRDDENSEKFLAHTENIGAGGICVIVKENVKMFSEVCIEVDLMDMGDNIKCKGKVVWNVQRKSDEETKPLFYDIGIEFQDLSTEDQARIDKSVDQLVHKDGPEEAAS